MEWMVEQKSEQMMETLGAEKKYFFGEALESGDLFEALRELYTYDLGAAKKRSRFGGEKLYAE